MTRSEPFLSVIVPVHNARELIVDTLGAVRSSELPGHRWELVVVDDASTDGSAELATAHADRVVRLCGDPRGPAFARNRGAEASQGEVLVFLDADVRIASDALSKIDALFSTDPSPGAVFGSYDDHPPAPGLVSRYRNLLHHYHHHRGAGDAETFWAGLGAVRADVFRAVGCFDEDRYARPQIEDIELGRRIRRAGHRIVLDPTIQGSHLKRWTIAQVVRTDLLHRGIPWTRLLLSEGAGGNTLNVRPKEKLCVALVGSSAVALVIAVGAGSWFWLLVAMSMLAVVAALNVELYRYLSRGRGVGFAIGVVPLHIIYYLTSGLSYAVGTLAHRLERVFGRGGERAASLQTKHHDD